MVWHTIPARAPNFGGLWEAAVKSAKFHLKRVIGKQVVSFEEMLTITCQVEACLNSRPLGVQHCQNPEGIEPLTPGHFLTGAPLTAYPDTGTKTQMTLTKRWTLCQQITHDFWRRWSAEHLQQLNLQTNGTILVLIYLWGISPHERCQSVQNELGAGPSDKNISG